MRAILIFSAFSAAGYSAPSPTPNSFFNITRKLTKIANTCLTSADLHDMTGHIAGTFHAKQIARGCFSAVLEHMGITELRKMLNFKPPGPWRKEDDWDDKKPSEEELEKSTLEEYYNLKEPIYYLNLENIFCIENNLPSLLAYFEKKIPSIQEIFKRRFEEVRGSGELDRKLIDKLLKELISLENQITPHLEKMLDYWKDVDGVISLCKEHII